jgi:hypothetical protein
LKGVVLGLSLVISDGILEGMSEGTFDGVAVGGYLEDGLQVGTELVGVVKGIHVVGVANGSSLFGFDVGIKWVLRSEEGWVNGCFLYKEVDASQGNLARAVTWAR